MKSVATPEGKVNYEYNLLGGMTRLSTTTGLDQRFTYDALGQLKTVVDQSSSGETGTYTYQYEPTSGRLTDVEYHNGVVISYTYDAHGFLDTIVHAEGATPWFFHDDDEGRVSGLRPSGDVAIGDPALADGANGFRAVGPFGLPVSTIEVVSG